MSNSVSGSFLLTLDGSRGFSDADDECAAGCATPHDAHTEPETPGTTGCDHADTATISQHWARVPRLTKISWISFVVLLLLTMTVGAVFFPDGGPKFSYAFIPVGLNLSLVGGLTLTNYRGTADALLGLHQAMERHIPALGPRSSRGLNRFIAAMSVLLGFVIAIAAPLSATTG